MQNVGHMITFEQPMNEYLRLCLRIEHLFEQLELSQQGKEPWHSRIAISQILHLMTITERVDLKSKLLHLLKQCRQYYQRGSQNIERDFSGHEDNSTIVDYLNFYINSLTRMERRFGDSIRHSEFLHKIRLQSANPAGVVPFNSPEFYLWLCQSAENRQNDIASWAHAFEELKCINRLLLHLVRVNHDCIDVCAENGFHHERLDASVNNHLVSVKVDAGYQVFPEISVGRQRISVHFMYFTTNFFQKVTSTIPFQLTFHRFLPVKSNLNQHATDKAKV